nr:CGNR zinc finger domain-containing protein [Paenibacillus oenotherae]
MFLLGGSPWINLLNTLVMHNKQPTDLLADPEMMGQWLAANQLLPESHFPLDEAAYEPLRASLAAVRELCTRILSDLESSGELSGASFSLLKEHVERLNIELTASLEGGKPTLLYTGQTSFDGILYTILSSVFSTLNHVNADRIRKCEHEDCILHFIDVSKSGKRRWCSMESCGNRNKAAQFYDKTRKQRSSAKSSR